MLNRETIAVYSEIHTKYGKNVEFLSVRSGGIQSLGVKGSNLSEYEEEHVEVR
jgi:hypothetical protein